MSLTGKVIDFLGYRGGMWNSSNTPTLGSEMASDSKKKLEDRLTKTMKGC